MEDTFATRLVKKRESLGLTRYALAKRANLHQSTLRYLEEGADPHLSTVHALAAVLECQICDLIPPQKKTSEETE